MTPHGHPTTLFRGTLLLALSVIFYLAFSPSEGSITESLNDKLSHVLAFAVLAWLFDLAFPRRRPGLSPFAILLAIGIFIEAVQYFLPYRESSWLDVLADAVGIVLYFSLAPRLRRLAWLQ